jgi:hypothetical protein
MIESQVEGSLSLATFADEADFGVIPVFFFSGQARNVRLELADFALDFPWIIVAVRCLYVTSFAPDWCR